MWVDNSYLVKKRYRRPLSEGDRRRIAKLVCAGFPRKIICNKEKISGSTLCNIVKKYVIISMMERFRK